MVSPSLEITDPAENQGFLGCGLIKPILTAGEDLSKALSGGDADWRFQEYVVYHFQRPGLICKSPGRFGVGAYQGCHTCRVATAYIHELETGSLVAGLKGRDSVRVGAIFHCLAIGITSTESPADDEHRKELDSTGHLCGMQRGRNGG